MEDSEYLRAINATNSVVDYARLGQIADRIDKLERALQSCKVVLEREEDERAKFAQVASDAIQEATWALMVT